MFKNYEEIEIKFIEELIKNGIYVSEEQLHEVLDEMKLIFDEYKDGSIEDMMTSIIEDLDREIQPIVENNQAMVGENITISTGMLTAQLYGGSMDEIGRDMQKDAIFDVASINKQATQTIMANLDREGYFKRSDKVSKIDQRFKTAGNLTMFDLQAFNTSYEPIYIDSSNSVRESYERLTTLTPTKKEYRYQDFSTMAQGVIAEELTGKSYSELFDKYIIKKLDLKNTYLEVPEEKRSKLTGTPNAHLGLNNDRKAIKMGGAAGHSGMMTDTKDLHTIIRNMYTNDAFFPKKRLVDVQTESKWSKADDWSRGLMGNAIATPGSFMSKLAPYDSSAYQGSTRTQVNIGTYNGILTSATTLFNPASMGLDRAYELEERINAGRKAAGEKKIDLVSEYDFEGQHYAQISVQMPQVVPVSFVRPITNSVAKASLKMAFLHTVVKTYDTVYDKPVEVSVQTELPNPVQKLVLRPVK